MKSLLSQIKYAHYDGSDVTTVVSNVANPVAITVYGNYIYYSDTVLELIERADKNSGSLLFFFFVFFIKFSSNFCSILYK